MITIENCADIVTALGFPTAIFVGIRSLYINRIEKIRNAKVEYEEEFCNYSKLRKDFIFQKTDIDNFEYKDFQELMFELISILTSIKKILNLLEKGKINNFGRLQMLLGDVHYFEMLLHKFSHLKFAGLQHHIEVLIPDILDKMDKESKDYLDVVRFKADGDEFLKQLKANYEIDENIIENFLNVLANWISRGIDIDDNSQIAIYFREGDWQKKQYPAVQLSSTYNLLRDEVEVLLSKIISRHSNSKQMKRFVDKLQF